MNCCSYLPSVVSMVTTEEKSSPALIIQVTQALLVSKRVFLVWRGSNGSLFTAPALIATSEFVTCELQNHSPLCGAPNLMRRLVGGTLGSTKTTFSAFSDPTTSFVYQRREHFASRNALVNIGPDLFRRGHCRNRLFHYRHGHYAGLLFLTSVRLRGTNFIKIHLFVFICIATKVMYLKMTSDL